MTNFFYKNRYKFVVVILLGFLALGLTSCRMDAQTWYSKPYTTYTAEWVELWDDGRGFWAALWGWPITILSYPIALLCSSIGKAMGNSYFWGIVFTTIIVRTLAWPIYSKQNGMSLKMQLMQPEMARIQRKYGGRQDQRSQQMMQQEMMKLYKKYKVNPLGCMTTMFLQFPIFISVYEVVQRINATTTKELANGVTIVENGVLALTNTKIFGYFEMNTSFFAATTVHDKIFAVVIALMFGGLTILQQKLAQRPPKYQKKRPKRTTSEQDQQQKQMNTMMIVMNVMFVFMSLSSTSLAIYWLIGAIYQIFQSQLGRKINEYRYYKLEAKNQNNII